MDKIELVQKIGNEVCEGCGPDRDCELELDECFRISEALNLLSQVQPEDSPNSKVRLTCGILDETCADCIEWDCQIVKNR